MPKARAAESPMTLIKMAPAIHNSTWALAMFNFLWIFIDVYQMGGVSVADRSGSAAAFIPGAQGLGQTAGPFAASIMLDFGWGFDGVFILCAMASASALCIYAFIYVKYRDQTWPH